MSKRIEKINALIQKHLSEILLQDVDLKPGIFLTVVKVDTTPDLRYTRVFISIFPEREIDYIQKTLEHEMFRIQGRLNRLLSMKPLPRIEFKVDMTESQADKIEKLLNEI